MPGINKVSGAEVAVRVIGVIVRIEVEQAIVIAVIVTTANIQGLSTRVRIHGQQNWLAVRRKSRKNYTAGRLNIPLLIENNEIRYF